MAYVSNEELFPVWVEPRSFWERTGLTPEQQRRLNIAMVVFVLLLVAGTFGAAPRSRASRGRSAPPGPMPQPAARRAPTRGR